MIPEEAFVRGAWMSIPSEDDVSWLRRIAKLPLTSQPLGDYGALIRRLLECGVSEYEIARFAKIVGYETAFGITYCWTIQRRGFLQRRIPRACHGGFI
jgi:hypothetical protein